jgi:hypothetical protein
VGDLRQLSKHIEDDTGYDSVETIEKMYLEGPNSYLCCFPECSFRRADPEEMWKHVHLGPKHHPDGYDIVLARWSNFIDAL